MPSPSLMQRCKQCQQKIEEVEKMLSKGDRNALISMIDISLLCQGNNLGTILGTINTEGAVVGIWSKIIRA